MEVYNVHQALKILQEYYITDSIQMVTRWIREGKIKAERSANRKCKLSLYFGTKETFFCTFLQKALSPFLKECAKFFVNYFGRENPSVHRRGRRT